MRRPHPATVIATIALVGAWGGPAVAAALIDGSDVKNESLTGRDVKNRSITGDDVKANSLTGGDITRLTGRDVMQDSLDGFNIYEDGLGPVPSATRADSAAAADTVGGLTARKIHFAKPGGTTDTPVLDLAGLRLRARCTAPNAVELDAQTTKDDAALHVGWTNNPSSTQAHFRATDDFDVASAPFDVLPDGADNVQGTLTYTARDGSVVTVTFMAESGPNGPTGGAGCLIAGTALGG